MCKRSPINYVKNLWEFYLYAYTDHSMPNHQRIVNTFWQNLMFWSTYEGVWIQWNGMMDWNGGMEWNVDKLDGFNGLSPPYNDHL